jgi:hypothetical protein
MDLIKKMGSMSDAPTHFGDSDAPIAATKTDGNFWAATTTAVSDPFFGVPSVLATFAPFELAARKDDSWSIVPRPKQTAAESPLRPIY